MKTTDGRLEIVDEDRLCYLVRSKSKGAEGLRTISKSLLNEFIAFVEKRPDAKASEARITLSGKSEIDKYEYGYDAMLIPLAKFAIEKEKELSKQEVNVRHLQQIYYGAPGTGKSHRVKALTEGKKVIRTTFHPDSDYSTFVGAYKPTMRDSVKEEIYSFEELKDMLSEMRNKGGTRPCQKFGAKYYKSLMNFHAKETIELVTSCDFPESMHTELEKGVDVGEFLAAKSSEEGEITYAFVPQTFLQAYVEAWKTWREEDVYLVIEEINRGNCAQIFGDLFQLLDRDDKGYSEYPIKADRDMQMYLEKALGSCLQKISGYSPKVAKGEELVLPNNLHILATMNTSDQSLFPIDSAFKRRWDWKYIPISNSGKDWKIVVGKEKYDWWGILEKINEKIEEMTDSQDKKLGYFFVKAADNVIDSEMIVNKVFFYLWNDVFKDFGIGDGIFKDKNGGKLTFDKFYHPDGSVNEAKVKMFIENIIGNEGTETT